MAAVGAPEVGSGVQLDKQQLAPFMLSEGVNTQTLRGSRGIVVASAIAFSAMFANTAIDSANAEALPRVHDPDKVAQIDQAPLAFVDSGSLVVRGLERATGPSVEPIVDRNSPKHNKRLRIFFNTVSGLIGGLFAATNYRVKDLIDAGAYVPE